MIAVDASALIAYFLREPGWKRLVLGLRDESLYLDRALEVALNTGLTVCDSLYVALALEERLPLLTLDDRQRRAARELRIPILP